LIDLSDPLREYRIFVDVKIRKTIGLKVDEHNEQTWRCLAFWYIGAESPALGVVNRPCFDLNGHGTSAILAVATTSNRGLFFGVNNAR
jgi:hypothetical protein